MRIREVFRLLFQKISNICVSNTDLSQPYHEEGFKNNGSKIYGYILKILVLLLAYTITIRLFEINKVELGVFMSFLVVLAMYSMFLLFVSGIGALSEYHKKKEKYSPVIGFLIEQDSKTNEFIGLKIERKNGLVDHLQVVRKKKMVFKEELKNNNIELYSIIKTKSFRTPTEIIKNNFTSFTKEVVIIDYRNSLLFREKIVTEVNACIHKKN